MRRYSADDEERIRTQASVREWTRSGLLDAEQAARLIADLHVDLRRTNQFLRGGLALFTALTVAATVALAITFLHLTSDSAIAAIAAVAALACIALADFIVARFHCYRFGVEEALAVAAVVLLAFAGGESCSALVSGPRGMAFAVALVVGSAAAFGVFRRFGFVYAAVASVAGAAAIAFPFDVSATIQRLVAVGVIGSAFAAARSRRRFYGDEHPADDYALVQAAAWAGLYLVVNLELTPTWNTVQGPFYWCTYVLTWVLPPVGIWLGVRDKDRRLIDVSLLSALATLLTNKLYLKLPHHPWDPILLGVLLIATALAVRRWLMHAPSGERRGFTSARLLDNERALVARVSTLASAAHQEVARPVADAPPSAFAGGRSGGAGTGGSF